MSATVDVLAAERDARTIYDIACIREQSEAASREDVEFKAITLRNYQFCIAVAGLVEAARTYFNGYCVDEAEDDFEDSVFGLNTGCTPEQHEDAKRLRDALANVGGQS